MAVARGASDDARSAFHRELRRATRSSSVPAGVLILLAFLAWGLLDRALEPAQADRFLAVRLVAEVTVALAWVMILTGRVRGLALEWTSFSMFLSVQVAIAWMVPQVERSFEAYLLGFSLGLYGAGIIVAWRWRFSVLLAACSGVALAAFEVGHPSTLSARDLTIAVFYLGTAMLVAVVAQYVRYQSAWREFRTRAALEEEQRRSDTLVAELARLSREDELTGLVNRRGWQESLDDAFEATRRRGGSLTIVLCDLDRFKDINDEHGHAAGDEVLRRFAALLAYTVRSTDTVARLGGDEFGVICPRMDPDAAGALAARLVEATRGLDAHDLGVAGLSASVGTATSTDLDGSAEALIARADRELYRAKETRDAAWASGARCDVPVHRPPHAAPVDSAHRGP